MTAVLSTIALVGLLYIFITRISSAIAVPQARLSWLASGVGCLALLARGKIVPLPILDGWLGGTNLINLVQNILATVAFWLVIQAASGQNMQSIRKLSWMSIVLIVAMFSIAFFFIDRGATASDFIVARSGQIPLWLYASIYMVGIAGMCVSLVVKVYKHREMAYWALLAGALMVAFASFVEIAFLTLQCFSIGTPELRSLAHHTFDPFFYPGIALIAIGIAILTARRAIHARKILRQVGNLEEIVHEIGLVLKPPLVAKRGRISTEVGLQRLYELVIILHDYQQANSFSLRDEERYQLAVADETIADQLLGASDVKSLALDMAGSW